MLDKTIDSALQNLRRNLIRNGGDGLEHVEALMRIRGMEFKRVLTRKRGAAAKRGQMRRIVLAILFDGPKRMCELVPMVHAARPDIEAAAAYQRTGQVLVNLKLDGLVVRDGRVWGLSTRYYV